ncbi:hypothetical protein DIE18_03890 [Burkholderia sp. Bp9125]|nr:hypothetical protein DIE18_03890 [Burkholderia sp. Bp9125]
MSREVMHLPSAEGHGEYDLYALAPAGLSADQARSRINDEIRRANSEFARNCMNCCKDGMMPKQSMMAALVKEGFEFFKPTMTYCWDESPS